LEEQGVDRSKPRNAAREDNVVALIGSDANEA
jgi:hypothetical protein